MPFSFEVSRGKSGKVGLLVDLYYFLRGAFPRDYKQHVRVRKRKNDQVFRSYSLLIVLLRTMSAAAAAAAATAASRATANRQRTAVPREPPELRAYKTRFNAYLVAPASSGGLGLPPVDDLTPEDVASPGDIESIMCSWAEYMMANPPRNSRNTEKLLKADGVGNGFGLVKEYLKDKFGRHDDWKDETWFTLSKGALVKKLERDSVRGTSGVDEVPGKIGIVRVNPDADIVEGHAGISTTPFADDIPDLVTIIRKLLKTSKLGDKEQRRLALNLTYAADGRSGEAKYLNYQSMGCDPVGNCAAADWKDLKNGTTRPITFCADYDRWETCVFDSLGDHWSVDGGLSRPCNSSGNIGFLSSFVVPMCHLRNDAWTSTMLTSTLRDGMPDSIRDSVSGRSLRYGGTTHLHEDPSVNHPELTARSGHAPADNSRHYVLSRRGTQYVPMRSLAGCPSPRKSHRPPRLIAIGTSAEDLALMEAFADKLYPSTMPDFKAGGRLRQLVREVLATNIMHFSSKLSFLGVAGPAVRRMMTVAEELGVNLSQLKEWSKKVAEDYKALNVPYSSTDEELAAVVAENNRLVADLRKEIADLKALEASNARMIVQLETQLQESNARALNMLPVARPTPAATPTASAGTDTSAGGTVRRRDPSPARSPSRNVRQRTGEAPGFVSNAISTITGSPAALARRITGRQPLPPLRPPAIPSSSGGYTSTSKGKKKNQSGVAVSDVVIELARTGRLKSGTAFEDTAPPLNLFPSGLASSEMNKYKFAMRVASAAVTEDQEKVFRAAEIDDAELIQNAKALDEGCRNWIAKALGRKAVGKLTAKVLGLGANARNVPGDKWPRPQGGLFGSMFRRNN